MLSPRPAIPTPATSPTATSSAPSRSPIEILPNPPLIYCEPAVPALPATALSARIVAPKESPLSSVPSPVKAIRTRFTADVVSLTASVPTVPSAASMAASQAEIAALYDVT